MQDASCAALQARATAAAPKHTRVQHSGSTRNQHTQYRKGHKHRDRETHAVSKGTPPKDCQSNGQEQHQSTEKMEAKIAYSPIPTNKVTRSRQSHLPDCENPSRRTEPTRSLTTHHDPQAPHATTEPSSITARPSEPSGPPPARRDKKGQHQTEKSR